MPPASESTPGAVAWASFDTLLRQGMLFATGIVLARLLTPVDFGLVAMLAIFTALAAHLIDSGFALALIQQREESNTDSSTVFWFNIASGTVTALLLGACAPLIAHFYGRPELVPLTWAMALNVWLASWLTVHIALLTRHLNFRVQAKASGISNLIGAALAITLAIRGAGVWALVAQALATTFLNVIVIWWLHPWRPTATFSMHSFRKLFRFGGFMLAAIILDAVATQLYSLLIGRLYSGKDLGLYTRAVTTRDASQTTLGTIFSRVAFPVLARHGNAPAALRKRLKISNQLTMAINLPVVIGLSMVADVAVPTLFGPQWKGTVPILQILCLAGALYPMHVTNLQVLMAQSHSGRMFSLGAMKSGILVISMLIASHWGMLAIAWATVFSTLISFFLNTHYSRTLIGYGAVKQLRDVGAYMLLTAGMAVVVAVFAHTLHWLTPGKRLLVEVTAGATFYLGMTFVLRLPVVGFAMEVLRSLRHKQPGSD